MPLAQPLIKLHNLTPEDEDALYAGDHDGYILLEECYEELTTADGAYIEVDINLEVRTGAYFGLVWEIFEDGQAMPIDIIPVNYDHLGEDTATTFVFLTERLGRGCLRSRKL